MTYVVLSPSIEILIIITYTEHSPNIMIDTAMESFVSGKSVVLPSGNFAASLKEEDEKNKDNILLAERTSQLMSSYRDYISEVDNEMKGYSFSDNRRTPSTKPGPLIRDWNSASAASLNEVPFGSSDSASLIDDHSYSSVGSKERKYSHPIFQSKKFKRSLLTGVVVACALIGVVVGVKKQMRPTNLPDWNEELKEVLEEETTSKAGVRWPAPDLEESFIKEGDITSDSKPSAGAASPEDKIASILHSKFKPIWFGAKSGWNGGSHDDAVKFCESTRGRKVCPYAAICPQGDGDDAIVMGGLRTAQFNVEDEQYAPVFGKGNNWVMIGQKEGDPSAKCKTYHQLEKADPDWGLTSDRADIKKHIMCCNVN